MTVILSGTIRTRLGWEMSIVEQEEEGMKWGSQELYLFAFPFWSVKVVFDELAGYVPASAMAH